MENHFCFSSLPKTEGRRTSHGRGKFWETERRRACYWNAALRQNRALKFAHSGPAPLETGVCVCEGVSEGVPSLVRPAAVSVCECAVRRNVCAQACVQKNLLMFICIYLHKRVCVNMEECVYIKISE